jgi:DNA polymerase-3 subunit gamma/tau
MDNYTVSALKYRPTTFKSVVGQQALTTTLKNAILNNKLAHAYLFCGPRGVGKTTCARIFAKTINCTNLTPDGEACNECESCRSFNEQRSLNIYELDAASNNGVEDIKTLIDQVRIPPQIGKYKVYIIDEVHMLSTAAFNAFLKTLEEPPKYVIFILATTEKHKVLPTILSRCQIYDFSRISVQDIVEQLAFVAEKENIKADRDALNIIAMKADGGMRDSLSIFDQAANFTGGNITYKGIIENLNVLDYEYFFRLTDMFLAKKVTDSLLLFNEILNKGFEGGRFIEGLASHFRDILVAHDESTVQLLEVSDNIRKRYIEQAKKCPVKFLYKAIRICNDCDINYRSSRNKRLTVELALIELAQIMEDDPSCGGNPTTNNIKPIKKETVAVTSQPVQQVKDNNKESLTESPKKESSTVSVPTESPVKAKPSKNITDLLNEKDDVKSDVPVISFDELGVSLNGGANPTEEVSETPQNLVVDGNDQFSESELRYQINQFAKSLPIEKKALSLQIQNFIIKMNGTASFDFLVDNELAANEFQSVKDDMQMFLRKALNNGSLDINVHINETNEHPRPVGRRETYQYMTEKNHYLINLQRNFGLELS